MNGSSSFKRNGKPVYAARDPISVCILYAAEGCLSAESVRVYKVHKGYLKFVNRLL